MPPVNLVALQRAIDAGDLVLAIGEAAKLTAMLQAQAQLQLREPSTDPNEPLLTTAEAARRLGVSSDYIRDHGERLGIAVQLDGVTRYDPHAIAQLRSSNGATVA